MEVNFASLYKLFEDDKAMKNAMMWITKNLKKTKITAALGKNIIFFGIGKCGRRFCSD